MRAYVYCLVAALLGAAVASGQQRDAPPGRTEAEEGIEVLTRGPVHEAFAETISFDPQPGVIVEKPAPEAIEEMPPEQKPEGANVDWIPGYWAWDDERSDYLWVSGIWRSLPPGRQVGKWLLGPVGPRLPVDFRILGGCQGERSGIPPRAAGDDRRRPQYCRPLRGPHLVPRLLGLASIAVCLAARLLGHGTAELGLDPGSLRVVPARLRVCR
jgi:hypothetical protein